MEFFEIVNYDDTDGLFVETLVGEFVESEPGLLVDWSDGLDVGFALFVLEPPSPLQESA